MSDDKQARPSKSDWQREYDATRLRDVPFETMSGVPVDPVYGGGQALLLSQLKRGYRPKGEEKALLDRLALRIDPEIGLDSELQGVARPFRALGRARVARVDVRGPRQLSPRGW